MKNLSHIKNILFDCDGVLYSDLEAVFGQVSRKMTEYISSKLNVDQSIIDKIIADKKVPVIAPLGLDKNDQTYNINADTAAGYIAKKN